MNILTTLTFFSAFSFVFFGLGCFLSPRMKSEYIRYGLDKYRSVVGFFQLLGALGLLLGYYLYAPLQFFSALGLGLLMVAGFGVRLKIRDTIWQSLPSLLYALINGYIFIQLAIIL